MLADDLRVRAVRLFAQFEQRVARGLALLRVFHDGQPLFGGFLELRFAGEALHGGHKCLAALLDALQHAKAELGVVFKQGVLPRRAAALAVLRVGEARLGAAPDGGAARGVGDIHALAEELGGELGVR